MDLVLGALITFQSALVIQGVRSSWVAALADLPADAPSPGVFDPHVLAGGVIPLLGLLSTLAVIAVVRRGVLAPVRDGARQIRDMAHGIVPASVPTIADHPATAVVADLQSALAVHWSNALRLERETQRRQQAERLLTLERKVLGMTAARMALGTVLSTLCLGMEVELEGGLCTLTLTARNGTVLRPGAAPSLSGDYNRAIDGVPVGEGQGSCGTSIHRRELVVVSDIRQDPLWARYQALAEREGVRACWSIPVLASDGRPLGAFAVYFREVRAPEDWMLDLVRRAARLAMVAISAEQAAEELERAKASAEQANRTKTQFLANMSHELRTPLNAIIGFAEVLDADLQGHPEQVVNASYAADIVASGRHLLAMINDILDVSKMEAGKVELRERICDVPSLLAGCERIARARALEKHIELMVDKSWDLPLVMVDDVKIRQILLNLMSNAVKFTPTGGRVRLKAALNTQGQMVFSVSDTGIGISRDDLGNIFVPFHQVDNVYTRAAQGTGLGLTLSKGLAELHGGWLSVDSELGVGTTVSLILPHHRLVDRDASDLSALS